MGRCCLVTLVAMLLGITLGLRAQTPEPLPFDAPAAEEEQLDLDPLIRAAEELRGLNLLEPLKVGSENRAEARETFSGEMPESDELSAVDKALRLMGLWNDERSLEDVLLDVWSDEVAGFYDPESEVLTMVEDDSSRGLPGFEAMGEAVLERLKDSIWVHEIGHALQDQHFDLAALIDNESFLSDRVIAQQSLVEGDATLMTFGHFFSSELERFPLMASIFTSFSGDPAGMAALFSQEAGEALTAAPSYLQQRLGFPYLGGLGFALAVRGAGGQKLLDHAFREAPPSSTEQIMHPEKWFEARDEPVDIDQPDLGQMLDGRPLSLSGTLGELGVLVWLTERLEDEGQSQAGAAAGWDGDRLALYQHDAEDPGVLTWISEWDSKEDAVEAYVALQKMLASTAELATSGRRVALVLGAEDLAVEPVLGALLAAPATRPEERPVDLAALGITAADQPQPLGGEELVELFSQPVIREILEQSYGPEAFEAFITLAEDPEALEMVMALGQELFEMEGGLDLQMLLESGDLESLQSSPAFQEVAQRMVERMMNLESTFQNQRLSIAEGRFSLTLPEAGSWKILQQASEAKAPGEPAILLQAMDESSNASVAVTAMQGPAFHLETIVGEIKAALDGQATRSVRNGYHDVGDYRFWENVFVGELQGQPFRSVQRIYDLGKILVLFAFSHPGEDESQHADLAQELFAGIQLFAAERPEPSFAVGQEEIVAPKKIRVVQPTFPPEARADRVQGAVILRALVQRDGRVHPEIDVLQSPDDRLSKAAIGAVRQWLYEPASREGEGIDVYYNLRINFLLEAETEEDAG